MSPPKKADLKKGGYGYGYNDEDAAFLRPDDPDGNWTASASGHGYNSRWSDDDGYKRGALGFTNEGGDGAVFNKLADEHLDGVHERLAGLIDGQVDQPAGKMLGGGGDVSQNADNSSPGWKGSERSGPRYSPKDTRGLSGNMKGWKR